MTKPAKIKGETAVPVTATFGPLIISQAAQIEGLKDAQVKTILAAAPIGWLQALVNHVSEPTTTKTALADWRKAFPAILNTGSDAGDSFLIRVAVAAAGGVAV